MNKALKKILIIAGSVIGGLVFIYFMLVALVSFDVFVFVPFQGKALGKKYLKEIRNIELPDSTEVIKGYADDTFISGTEQEQPFGGVIVRSDLSLEELDKHYAPYRASEEIQEKKELKDKVVTYEVRETLDEFGLEIPEGVDLDNGSYYLIYTTCFSL